MEKPKTVNLDDLFSEEDKAKAKARVDKEIEREEAFITREWYIIAELGYNFGYSAIQALFDDNITLEQAKMLIQGANKIHASHMNDLSRVMIASNSTNPDAYKKIMDTFIKEMKEIN